MNFTINCQLKLSNEQFIELELLQKKFAELCSAVSPIAQKNNCWNRVALHHLSYYEMRQKFPEFGSQMICNAIYAVCKMYRLLHALGQVMPDGKLKNSFIEIPRILFLETAPVYFDRHTLSVRNQELSIYSLNGRLHIKFDIDQEKLNILKKAVFREITLIKNKKSYQLNFYASDELALQSELKDEKSNIKKYLRLISANESMREVA